MKNNNRFEGIRGVCRQNESMANHTSWRVGGTADLYYEPADLEDLRLFLRKYSGTRPLLWLGLGSNILVRDGGYEGIVIAYSRALNLLEFPDPENVRVGAGTPCAKVAKETARMGMTGAEFLAGIPGCMGGALAMNAGAFGGVTWEIVSHVETVDRNGDIRQRAASDFDIGYRSVQSDTEEWFITAKLHLKRNDADKSAEKIKSLLRKRSQTQPTGIPSCGSVFRNPPGDHAARLIEECGLKGQRSGNACISEKHSNFIINLGGATSKDIETLISTAKKAVLEKFGIELVTEVKIVGTTRHHEI